MSINEELMDSKHHDLCFLSEACDGECICERLWQAENMARVAAWRLVDIDSWNEGRREALADAVQIVEDLPCKCNEGADYCDGQTDAIKAIVMLGKGDQP